MVNRAGVKNEGNYLQFENALNNIKGLSYSSGFSGSSHSDDLRTLLDTYKKVGEIDQRIKAVEKQAEREDERQTYSVLSQASQSMALLHKSVFRRVFPFCRKLGDFFGRRSTECCHDI